MPLFPYVCRSCAYAEERLVPASAARTIKCPECGKKTFVRELGTPVGMLYRPDKDKILDTMRVKKTTYGSGGEKLAVDERKVYGR